MEKSEIEKKVLEIAKEHFNEDDISLNSSLIYDIGADSLDFIELIMKAENEFNLKLDELDFNNVDNLQEAVNVLYRIINGLQVTNKSNKRNMWEEFYVFMNTLENKISNSKNKDFFIIERGRDIDYDLIDFCKRIGFISFVDYFYFKGSTFVLM